MYMIENARGANIRFSNVRDFVDYVNGLRWLSIKSPQKEIAYKTVETDKCISWLLDNGWDVWEKIS